MSWHNYGQYAHKLRKYGMFALCEQSQIYCLLRITNKIHIHENWKLAGLAAIFVLIYVR